MKEYKFRICDSVNYDGDSYNLTLDLGFELVIYRKCRMDGADTPELRSGDAQHRAAGELARVKVEAWIEEGLLSGKAWFVSETYTGKYGRPLGDIHRLLDASNNVESLRSYLFKNFLAVPYAGQAKSEVAGLHKANIAALQDKGWL